MLDGFLACLFLARLLLGDHTVNWNLAGDEDAAFSCLVEDSLDAFDVYEPDAGLNLVVTLFVAVHIFKVNAIFGADQEARLCLTWVMSELEVLEVQLAAHHVWNVVDDLTGDDVVIGVDNVLSTLKVTVKEMCELFDCLIF